MVAANGTTMAFPWKDDAIEEVLGRLRRAGVHCDAGSIPDLLLNLREIVTDYYQLSLQEKPDAELDQILQDEIDHFDPGLVPGGC